MQRDVNTSPSMLASSIASAIDLLPGAMLIVDADGRVLQHNAEAGRLLGLRHDGNLLSDRLGNGSELRAALQRARRSSGVLPVALLTGNGERVCASVRPIANGSELAPELLLITCQRQDNAAYRMRMLCERLDRAQERQRQLRRENRRLRKAVEETLPRLRQQSLTDPLTGIHNRRYFDRKLLREWQRARRTGGQLAVVFADVDRFKRYNDDLGHRQGDNCLRAVAGVLAGAVTREFDCACRIGGEEFALLLPMTGQQGAEEVALRARDALLELGMPHPDNVVPVVTASFGVGSCRPGKETEPGDFLDAVDRAMYLAKERGRNRVSRIDSAWLRNPAGFAAATPAEASA